MNTFEKDPVDYIASKNAEHNMRPLCAHCNMFGSVEDTPWAIGRATGTINGMVKVDGKWYHRSQCLEDAKKAKEPEKKPSATVIPFPPKKETPPTAGGEERRAA